MLKVLFTLLAFAMSVQTARADIVYLNDGTWVRGTITKETADEVEIDGKTNTGIAVKTAFMMSRVASIVHTDAPTPDETKKDAKPGDSKPDATRPGEAKPAEKAKDKTPPGDYLVIPLKGAFGEDIYPRGVETSLDWAINKGVKHIVFTIDSTGGQVWAAQAIHDMMKERASKLTYHIVIKEALSASIWVVFQCNTIGAMPGSTFGAAVAFHRETSGNAEVDEKFNSAMAGRLASDAETLGHSGDLLKAMILTKSSLVVVKGDKGWKFMRDKPADEPGKEIVTLSEGDRVVTLTAEQMVKFGVASKVAKLDEKELAAFAGDASFKSAGNLGEVNMKSVVTATKNFAKLLDNWAEQVIKSGDEMREAIKKDDVGIALKAVGDFRSQLHRVGSLRTQAKALGLLAYPALQKIDVAKDLKEADELHVKFEAIRKQRGGR